MLNDVLADGLDARWVQHERAHIGRFVGQKLNLFFGQPLLLGERLEGLIELLAGHVEVHQAGLHVNRHTLCLGEQHAVVVPAP